MTSDIYFEITSADEKRAVIKLTWRLDGTFSAISNNSTCPRIEEMTWVLKICRIKMALNSSY